jgi:hypothetical protein
MGIVGLGVSALLVNAGAAGAAWEPAKQVDNQQASAGTSFNYAAIADGANGGSTAFFTQTVNGKGGYYAIRRGASDAAWGTPFAMAFPNGAAVSAGEPLAAAADASGNVISATTQIVSGVPAVFANSWPAGASAPGGYSVAMSTGPANQGVTDPEVAFDSAGNGYAVSGVGRGASSDEPLLISTYTPATRTWSSGLPMRVQVNPANPASSTCPGGTPANVICGQEPRLAVSPDGTVVVVYLKTLSGQIPNTTQEQLFATRALPGAVAGSGGASSFINEVSITSGGNQVPLGPAPGAPNTPPNYDVTIDGSDTATVVDAESQTGINNQIFANRWPSGNVAPKGGVVISAGEPAPPASEPRLASDAAGDVTAMWTESGLNPTAATLLSAELIWPRWTAPQSFATNADSPSNPGGYPVNTPPFWLAEDGAGNAYAGWTSSGSLVAATRVVGKTWNPEAKISGVSSAVAGTARVASGLTGQADLLVVAGNGTRNALYASRFLAPVTPPSVTPSTPKPGPPAVPPGSKPRPLVPCHARPALRIFAGRTHATNRRIVVSGRASEHKCKFPDAAIKRANRVVKVYVTIYHPAPLGKCRFLRRNGTLTPTIPCTRPVQFLARGTQNWSLSLNLHVPRTAGGFLVRAWAVDGFGRQSVKGPASVTRLKLPKPKRHR